MVEEWLVLPPKGLGLNPCLPVMDFLCGVCMFSFCAYMVSSVSSGGPKTCRLICGSKLPVGVKTDDLPKVNFTAGFGSSTLCYIDIFLTSNQTILQTFSRLLGYLELCSKNV